MYNPKTDFQIILCAAFLGGGKKQKTTLLMQTGLKVKSVLDTFFINLSSTLKIHTQVAIDDLAVVNLAPHGTDLFEFCLLAFHSFFQPLQLLCFRHGLLLPPLLLLQIPQALLLHKKTHSVGD